MLLCVWSLSHNLLPFNVPHSVHLLHFLTCQHPASDLQEIERCALWVTLSLNHP